MGRFLVTGAAGFIGSHTVVEAVAQGHQIVALDSFSPYYDPALKKRNARIIEEQAGISVLCSDLGTEDIESLLDGIDGVLHLAGQPGVRQSWAQFDSYVLQNLAVTNRLLQGIKEARTPRIVYASSSSVYGNAIRYPAVESDPTVPFSPYGVTKLAAEHLVRSYSQNFGLLSVCLRYFTVYGPRQRPDMAFSRIADSMLRGTSFTMFGDGSQIRDFTYVGDVAEANIRALTAPLETSCVLNVSGGSSATMKDVFRLFENADPGLLSVVESATVHGDVHQTGGSNLKAYEVLGWRPKIGLQEGIHKQYSDSKRGHSMFPRTGSDPVQ